MSTKLPSTSTLTDETLDAAAEVVRANVRVRPHETVIDASVVPNILAAAYPHIAAHAREGILDSIDLIIDRYGSSTDAATCAPLADLRRLVHQARA